MQNDMTIADCFKNIVELQAKIGFGYLSVALVKKGHLKGKQELYLQRQRLASKGFALNLPEIIEACAQSEGVEAAKMKIMVEIPSLYPGILGKEEYREFRRQTSLAEMSVFNAKFLIVTIQGPTKTFKFDRTIQLCANDRQSDGKTLIEHIIMKTVEDPENKGMYKATFFVDDINVLKIPMCIESCIDYAGKSVVFRSDFHKAIFKYAIEQERQEQQENGKE